MVYYIRELFSHWWKGSATERDDCEKISKTRSVFIYLNVYKYKKDKNIWSVYEFADKEKCYIYDQLCFNLSI